MFKPFLGGCFIICDCCGAVSSVWCDYNQAWNYLLCVGWTKGPDEKYFCGNVKCYEYRIVMIKNIKRHENAQNY